MKAIIKSKNGIYDSFVFAYEMKNNNCKVIILNESNEFEVLECWKKYKPIVLFTDFNTTNYKYDNETYKSIES